MTFKYTYYMCIVHIKITIDNTVIYVCDLWHEIERILRKWKQPLENSLILLHNEIKQIKYQLKKVYVLFKEHLLFTYAIVTSTNKRKEERNRKLCWFILSAFRS